MWTCPHTEETLWKESLSQYLAPGLSSSSASLFHAGATHQKPSFSASPPTPICSTTPKNAYRQAKHSRPKTRTRKTSYCDSDLCLNHESVYALAIIPIPRFQHRTRGDFHWFSEHCSIQALDLVDPQRNRLFRSKETEPCQYMGTPPLHRTEHLFVDARESTLVLRVRVQLSPIQGGYRIFLSPHACNHCLHRDRGFFRPKCHHLDSR